MIGVLNYILQVLQNCGAFAVQKLSVRLLFPRVCQEAHHREARRVRRGNFIIVSHKTFIFPEAKACACGIDSSTGSLKILVFIITFHF